MKCKVEGCGRPADYKAAELCQKHYFRVRRNNTTDMVRAPAKPRIEDERGYQFLHVPTHPLLSKGQIYVAEHRVVLFAAIGPGPMQCAICGCGLTWKTCHVDHIDENPRNNDLSNLRPTCRRCNTWRNMPPAVVRMKNAVALTYEGITKTANQWAQDPRVAVSGPTILRRKRQGMTDVDALFGAKKTHNGAPKIDRRPLKTHAKHERSNAVAITYNGKTLTAAEWAREPGVTVSRAGLIWRLRQGWEPSRALFQQGRFA